MRLVETEWLAPADTRVILNSGLRAISALANGGTMVEGGMSGSEVSLFTPFLLLRVMSLHGSYVGSREEIAKLLQQVARTGMLRVPK